MRIVVILWFKFLFILVYHLSHLPLLLRIKKTLENIAYHFSLVFTLDCIRFLGGFDGFLVGGMCLLQRNLDQLETMSKKLKAKTLRTEAPTQSIAATRFYFFYCFVLVF